MVAGFARYAAVALVWVLGFGLVTAVEAAEGVSPPVSLAQGELAKAVSAFEESLSACEDSKAVIDIPRPSAHDVDREHLLVGLSYLSLKAENACVLAEAKDFVFAVQVMERFLAQESDLAPEGLGFADIVMEAWRRELEAKAAFHQQVPLEHREFIESIVGADKPFDLVASWTRAGY